MLLRLEYLNGFFQIIKLNIKSSCILPDCLDQASKAWRRREWPKERTWEAESQPEDMPEMPNLDLNVCNHIVTSGCIFKSLHQNLPAKSLKICIQCSCLESTSKMSV